MPFFLGWRKGSHFGNRPNLGFSILYVSILAVTPLSYLYYVAWLTLTITALWNLLLYRREPYSTLTWIFFILLVPVLGPLIFFVFGPQRIERRARKRDSEILASNRHSQILAHLEKETLPISIMGLNEEDLQILRLGSEISNYPATNGNTIELFSDPETTLLRMESAINRAQKFIHLEYYIFSNDEVTARLFECLLKAAQRGVEVRILYDSIGSFFLKRIYFHKLVQNGVRVAGFLPFMKFPHPINFHFRNHRKILIIDGINAFSGGTNIGREYLGKRNKNQWRDSTVEVTGPICLALEDVFARDWHFTTQETLLDEKYYPPSIKRGDSLIQPVESGPQSPFHALHHAVFMALNAADKSIQLTTPYFVPDSSVLSSLISAALRGVDVTLLLPAKTDAPFVKYASRSFYEELLEAGVKIFEYQPRILHAKLLTIDNRWTLLGSGNMDVRSFKLNFELNLMVYGKEFSSQTLAILAKDLEQSREILLSQFRGRPISQKIIENFCRLFTPIL